MADLPSRVDALERGLQGVAARGQGKERSGRLVLCFASGSFREHVLDLLRTWEQGAAAARATQRGGQEREGGGEAAVGSADSSGSGLVTFFQRVSVVPIGMVGGSSDT